MEPPPVKKLRKESTAAAVADIDIDIGDKWETIYSSRKGMNYYSFKCIF